MMTPPPHNETPTEVNLGILDGDVPHADINRSIAGADRVILFGEQTRLPHFPEDQRLLKLHSGLVLLFWEVLKKVPEHVRPDRAPGYRQLVAEPASMGETARQELHQVHRSAAAARRRRGSTFRIQKQAIVA